MRQSALFFVAAGLCAAATVTSMLTGRVSVLTALTLGLTGIVLALGLRSRSAGN